MGSRTSPAEVPRTGAETAAGQMAPFSHLCLGDSAFHPVYSTVRSTHDCGWEVGSEKSSLMFGGRMAEGAVVSDF